MSPAIFRVKKNKEIMAVAELADEIWRQHFTSIIGEDQVNYMLDKFQSPGAISGQVESGAEYYLVTVGVQPVAYLCLIPEPADGKMMLSKIYVKQEARGTGVGNLILKFAEAECNNHDINTLWLTVNRFNNDTVKWYRQKGFNVVDEVKKDIGGGFYMDDFIMEKQV